MYVLVILVNNLFDLPCLALLYQSDFSQVFPDPAHDLILFAPNPYTDTLAKLVCDYALISEQRVEVLNFDVFVNFRVVAICCV